MRRKALTLSMFAALAITFSACSFTFSTARIADAKLSKEVSDSSEALNPTNAFDSADPP
jgi:Na+-translocating ferredoxin:NAD+ oxidoreductase RnfG subunit